MASTNEEILSALLRHQIYLERYKRGAVQVLRPILQQAQSEIEYKISKLSNNSTKAQLKATLREIKQINEDMNAELYDKMNSELQRLSKTESVFTAAALRAAIPSVINLKIGVPSSQFLSRVVATQPFHGLVLDDWVKRIGTSATLKAKQQLFIGLAEGESVDKIVKRFAFIGDQTQNDLSMVVRTSVNAVTNQVKDAVYSENSDVIQQVQWRSTLDGRTSDICRARDGMVWDVDEDHPVPPAHPNCRSVIVPVVASLADLGLSGEWSPSTRASMNGQVPDDLTYNDWLKTQSKEFVNETLGPTRASLYLNDGLTLDKFVDDVGHTLTLDQLEAKYPSYF